MWERWDGTWDELKTVPDEFIDGGQHVLVTVHYSARGRGSGIKYEERLFDVYTFSDGECVREQEFRERSKALDPAGLNSWSPTAACRASESRHGDRRGSGSFADRWPLGDPKSNQVSTDRSAASRPSPKPARCSLRRSPVRAEEKHELSGLAGVCGRDRAGEGGSEPGLGVSAGSEQAGWRAVGAG
jgi:hypothetical protein